MTDFEQRIASLSPEKLALLMERLGETAPSRLPDRHPGRIQTRDTSGPQLLSFAQERLWFLDRLAPGSSDYNVPGASRIHGAFNVVVFAQAMDEILRRHGVLRTRFEEREGRPVQIVVPRLGCNMRRADFTGVAPDRASEELEEVTRDVGHRGFDLRRAPLLRIVVVRLGATHHVVLFTLHHIVCDGWSVELLMREVVELLRSYGAGAPSALEEPRFQYADFARWQREQLQGDRRSQLISYWKRQLLGASSELGLERPDTGPSEGEPPETEAKPAELQFAVPLPKEGMLAVGRQERVTSFMILVAVLATALHVETDRDDVCIGANAANRGELEAEELIGFFINQIVLRVRMTKAQTFRRLLAHVRDVVSEAHAHQDLPYEQLVDSLRAAPGRGESPLFRIKLELQEEMAGASELPGLAFEPLQVDWTPLRGDLLVTVSDSEDGFETRWSYDAVRLSLSTVQGLAETFRHIVRIGLQAPETTLESIAAQIAKDREQRQRQDRKRLRNLDAGRLKRARRQGVRLANETKG